MESDLGKLFIGGISWDTNEDRLRGYFKSFGDVVEAVIIKDRNTGRARGFGFVVFADPAVAERVVLEKHLIDGRMVEAKKAVPRDDQHALNRTKGSLSVSPSSERTKKIFVGGLSSTVTESDFKKYFEQFGTITDVVVMCDHNTQKPRGFGFITFYSEESIDKALHKTFHELNGKMAEVKRAVPKELSSGRNMRLLMDSYKYGLNRVNSLLFNGYSHGYNQGSIGNYAMRMDGQFEQLIGNRKGLHSFGPYGSGMNFQSAASSSNGENLNFSTGYGYGRSTRPYYSINTSMFNNSGSSFESVARNIWSDSGNNHNASLANSNSYMAFANGNLNLMNSSSSLVNYGVGNGSGFTVGNLGYGHGKNTLGFVAGGFGRNSGTGSVNFSFSAINNELEGNSTNFYGDRLNYRDLTCQSASSQLDGCDPFSVGIDSAALNLTKSSSEYICDYNAMARDMNTSG